MQWPYVPNYGPHNNTYDYGRMQEVWLDKYRRSQGGGRRPVLAPSPGTAEHATRTYILHRLGIAVLTLLGMSIVIFVLLRFAPGNIVDILFSTGGYVSESDKAAIIDRKSVV